MAKYQNSKILIALFITVGFMAILFSACHHPDEPTVPIAGKRDYKWSVDTLSYDNIHQTFLQSIWGSAKNDVYVVGDGAGGEGAMYHFDGVSWKVVRLLSKNGGKIVISFYLNAIYGFSKENIWAAGGCSDGSIIIHYDGSSWKRVSIPPGEYLHAIWGSSPNDIWAGGGWANTASGTLYHYDGTSWSKVSFDSTKWVAHISGFSSSDIYATCGTSISGPDTGGINFVSLLHWDGQSWSVTDSFEPRDPQWKFGLSLWCAPDHNLYSATYGVFHYETNKSWKKLFDNDWPLHVTGSSNENIFAIGSFYHIFHWNGLDWKTIDSPLGTKGVFYDAWTNNEETFIVGSDGERSYIMHGK